MAGEPFWRTVPLDRMTPEQWESLCDGCGRCCLVKIEEEETERVYYTSIACRLLDCESCRCTDYANRLGVVSDCVGLTPQALSEIGWLPPTCAYRLIHEGKPLSWWHPLVSGRAETVHEAGVSVRGRTGPREGDVALQDYEDHLVDWPLRTPKAARRRG